MERKMEQDVLRKLKRRRRRRLWRRLVSMMMCVVVFCTTYALILPAITKETEAFCGFEAHVHTGACYPKRGDLICEFAQTEIHIHTEDCHPVTEETPSCGLEEIEAHVHTDACVLLDEKVLCCTLKEGEGHTHSDTCAPLLEQTLSCKKVETEGHIHTDACGLHEVKTLTCTAAEAEGHTHTDACGLHEVKTLSCTAAESEGHTHTDACGLHEVKTLTCTVAEAEGHTHTDACGRNEERILSCDTAETAGHTHTDACSKTETVLTCDLAETEEHAHGDGCYTEVVSNVCGMEEVAGHSHTDACYTVIVSYGCNREEAAGHTHTDACYTVTTTYDCGLEAAAGHTHTDACYTVTTGYDCGLEEAAGHTHTDACYTVTTTYGCGLEEAEAHAHTDECYTITTIYGCGLEEAEAHTHGDACYTAAYSCGLKETEGHAHSDACYRTVYDCGQEAAAHVHTEACYAPAPGLVCTLEENGEHTHGVSCYTGSPVCGLEEHEHTLECYSDPTADLEGPSYWETTLPGSLTGNYAEDLLAVARSQLGYTESTRNYIVDDSGEIKGYTRYGAWYGFPHGDWCAMFVSFCLHYAKVDVMPIESSCANWVDNLRSAGMYAPAAGHTPQSGDIIFFDWNGDANPDHVGIVAKYFPAEENDAPRIQAIEGNCNNTVCYTTYNQADPDVLGYGILPVQEIAPTEIPELPEETIGPEDTIAWAELVGSVVQTPEEPEAAAEETVSARAYGLRKMSSTFRMAPRAGGPLDLTPYIRDVTMYDADGNPIPNGATVTEGDLIEFRIEYTVEGQALAVMNGTNLSVTSDTVVYQIPNTFKVIKDSSGEVRNSQKQIVGSFAVDSATNQLSITFNDAFVESNATGLAIEGKVSFFSTVVKITDEDDEEQDFKFTDEITLGVVIKEDIEAVGSVKIEKQKISVDGEKLIYEIKVFSEEGTTGPITITDQMSPGLTFVAGIEVRKGGAVVPDATFTPAADGSSFTMTLPEMAAGDSYTVRYRCEADIGLLGADMTARNTASVTAKDNKENELNDEFTVKHTFKMLEKTGTLNEDGSITWTITINHDKMDISGWILEDYLGGTEEYTGEVTIKRSDGTVLAANQKLPYTFPDGSNDTYTVTYTTIPTLGDGSVISNRVVLKDSDTEITEVAGVEVGTSIEKTGEGGDPMLNEAGEYVLPITWTVTIDTSGGVISTDDFLYDQMSGYPSDDMYMTYDQLMAALANIEAELIRVTEKGASRFVAQVLEPSYAFGPTYTREELAANKDNCQSMKFETFKVWPAAEVPKGNLLTFTYDAYGVFANNVLANTTYINRFSINMEHVVEGEVQHTGGSVEALKYAISYVDPADLDDPNFPLYWGSIDWNGVNGVTSLEYEKLKNAYLAWAIELDVPPVYTDGGTITIRENLPEGLTVKGVNIVFQDKKPINGLALRNLVPGETVNSVVTIYPGNQYDAWRPQGAKDVTISTTLTTAGDLEFVVPGEFFQSMSEYAAYNGEPEWYCFINIYTQINDDFAWTPTAEDSLVYVNNFENNVQVFDESGKRIDNDYQAQRVTKNERDTMIRKDVEVDDGVLNYSVLLNSSGRDLVPNASTLYVLDKLTYTSSAEQQLRLRLIAGTVKLYEAVKNADGTYGKGAQIPQPYIYNESSTETDGVTSWTHTLEMDVPDGKALILEYGYGASGDKEAVHEVRNVCSIEGFGDGILEGDSKVELEVKDSEAEANVDGIVIYKVDANDNGLYLQNAKFNVYIWNKDKNDYILVHHPNDGDAIFTTNNQGMISLDSKTVNEDQFAYNTAYYIVEMESPDGYYLSPEPYYFYIANDDTSAYPYYMPENFQGRALVNGDIIYRENVSDKTEISVEKYWKSLDGNDMTVTKETVPSITLELWQMLQGDPGSAKLYDTYTMTPDENGNWNLTITDLPKATKNVNGTKGTNYLYYIKEVGVNGFNLESSENNQGINSGIIKLINRKQIGYELPKTGGAGTNLYTMAGLLLMLTSAAYLMYSKHPRRREEF